MNNLVSVIIPAYNCSEYLRETLESVKNQTYKNLEVIIINDGSIDNTEDIILDYIKTTPSLKIKYIPTSNRGVSSARNTGIINSSGSYIAFLDGDDIWKQEKIERQMEKLVTNGANACYTGHYNWYFENNKISKNKINFKTENLLEYYLRGETWPQTSTWLIEKSLIINNNLVFNENLNWGEDFDFFARIISLGLVTCIDDFLVNYRLRSDSLSRFNKNHLSIIETWQNLSKWLQNSYLGYTEVHKDIIYNYRIPNEVIYIMSQVIKHPFSLGNLIDKNLALEYKNILSNIRSNSGLMQIFKYKVIFYYLNLKIIL